MPSSYTTSLRLVLPVTGELTGTWGDTVNNGLTQLVEAAIAGTASVTMTDANTTLTTANEAADQARNMFVVLTGTLSATREVICPAVSKLYFVHNNTTGGQSITFKTSLGSGVTVLNGQRAVLYCNGTNVIQAASVVYDSGDQTIGGTKTFSSAPVVPGLNGGQIAGMRNKIINGAFDIWQRGLSSAAAGGTFTADRWRQTGTTSGTVLFQRTQTIVDLSPLGFMSRPYCMRWVQTSGGAGNLLEQRIEDSRTLAGQVVTLSLIARLNSGSFPGTVQLGQAFGSGGSAGVNLTPQNLTGLTSDFQRFSFQFTLPEVGSKTIGAGDYLYVAINAPAGGGTWDLEITGVQLEVGSVATPFEHRPFGQELALCARYLPVVCRGIGPISMAWCAGTAACFAEIPFQVPARVAPTNLVIRGGGANFIVYNSVGAALDVATAGVSALSPTAARLSLTTAGGLSAGQATGFASQSATALIYFEGAEL